MRGVRAMVAGWVLVGTLVPGTAWAAGCAASTARARFALADIVFDGVAHVPGADGTAATVSQDAVTFSVRQWHKAPQPGGPATLTLRETAERPRAGEVWRIYANATGDGAWTTHGCSGTHALASLAEPPPFAAPGTGFTGALALATAGLGLRKRRRRGRRLSALAA